MVSKIYVATDSSPVDMQSYELCCDMIDVAIDVRQGGNLSKQRVVNNTKKYILQF